MCVYKLQHLVNNKYDEGRIIAQKIVPVFDSDSIEIIEENVKNCEPEFYVETIKRIINGDIIL